MKKLNKLVAILVAMAMVLALSVSSAFALSEDSQAMTDDNAAYLVKYLKIKEGITIPNETFTFTFSAYDDGTSVTEPVNSSTVKVSEVPAVGPATINTAQMAPSASTKDDGALVKAIKIEDILTGVNFPHAGEYIYKVVETNEDAGLWDYSDQVYYLHVFVKNGQSGTEVAGVTVEEEKDPVDPETDPTYEKKDVTDQDPSDGADDQGGTEDDKTQDQITETAVEGFTFINEYDKNGTLDKDGAFVVSKAVTGDYADKTYEFPFTISITKPEGYNGQTAIKAYILDVATANAQYATGTLKTVNIGNTATFNLKNNQKLVIPELPDGAQVTVTENLNTATDLEQLSTYTASYKLTDNGTEDTEATTGTAAAALATTAIEVKDADNGANVAAYTNNSTYTPSPTGILISNLPYIALALVAIGGLVAYVIVRRKADDEA